MASSPFSDSLYFYLRTIRQEIGKAFVTIKRFVIAFPILKAAKVSLTLCGLEYRIYSIFRIY